MESRVAEEIEYYSFHTTIDNRSGYYVTW